MLALVLMIFSFIPFVAHCVYTYYISRCHATIERTHGGYTACILICREVQSNGGHFEVLF